MLLFRPRLAAILARNRVVSGRTEAHGLVRRESTKTSKNSTNPQRPTSSTTSTAATMTAVAVTVAAGGGAAYYVYCRYYSSFVTNDPNNDLSRRQQLYQRSPRHRLRLAAYVVSPTNRTMITERVNKLINVPGIGEHTEGILIRKAVDQCMDALEQILVGDHDSKPLTKTDSANDEDDEGEKNSD